MGLPEATHPTGDRARLQTGADFGQGQTSDFAPEAFVERRGTGIPRPPQYPHLFPQPGRAQGGDVDPIQKDEPRVRLVKAAEECRQSALARTTGSRQSQNTPTRQRQIDTLQYLLEATASRREGGAA